jgi:hypothetical protein
MRLASASGIEVPVSGACGCILPGGISKREGERGVRVGHARDRLRPQAIGDLIRAACAAAGLAAPEEERRYSGHSLRRGGATAMLRAGAQPLSVSRHGRWADSSRSFAGYIEEATGFGDANPTKGLL